jgi:predicted metal-dependent hydrolase
MPRKITFNDLIFEVRYSTRKTIQIVVDRDGKLFVNAPKNSKTKHLKDFIKAKEFWIYQKLDKKNMLIKPKQENQQKKTFLYLGKKYQLRFEANNSKFSKNDIVSLKRGKFILKSSAKKNFKKHLIDWYTLHSKKIIFEKTKKLEKQTGLNPKNIRIMNLGNRWGSCSHNNILNFHWRTVLAPPRIINYIILHEMIHMLEEKHTPEFWKKLEKFMPDYLKRKQWLSENGTKLSI